MLSDIDQYQEWTRTTAVYSGTTYPRLALAEEVGELLGKIAKFERKYSFDTELEDRGSEWYAAKRQLEDDVEKEAGDVLWQLARVLDDFGIKMSHAVITNVAKLESRKQRDVINGEGDDR
jgi:NTP pyrophosphatase (non-canonical NTP hydrolase)